VSQLSYRFNPFGLTKGRSEAGRRGWGQGVAGSGASV